MSEYLKIFVDKDYPSFLDKYLATKTLNRLKYITQFCGCDYSNLYSPKFFFTRFDHSLVVAHMTWHFTHDKKATIAAILHDVGTPCFAHCIDYVFGDYLNQESSEKNIIDIIQEDEELLLFLKEDNISLEDLEDLTKYSVLENKSPKLCTDRLDGVLHTVYIWLHTHPLEEIKKVYDDMIVLTNEENVPEIGFETKEVAEKFSEMVIVYAKELQGNTDKYVMRYVAEAVKSAFSKNLISLDDLYRKKESEIIEILATNFQSWENFSNATSLNRTDEEPKQFYVSFATKKRNTIPLVKTKNGNKRINCISKKAIRLYADLENYKDTKYAFIENIREI